MTPSMGFASRIKHFLIEPPPSYAFEVSEAGIAFTRPGAAGPAWEPLEPDVVSASPLRDNVQRPEALAAAIKAIAGVQPKTSRRKAVLILPDYCTRITVLEFDAFPSDPEEQKSLVKFRVKKSVPFDVESAVVRHFAQPPAPGGPKKYSVLVAVAALEIVAKYEAAVRAAGFHPGVVTTSLLAAMDLLPQQPGVHVVVKLSGKALTIAVRNGALVKLVRCVELADASDAEMEAVLFPTVAFAEDELLARPTRLTLCGFGAGSEDRAQRWQETFEMPVNLLRTRSGALAGPYNAGLLGFLEGSGSLKGVAA